MWGGGKKTKSAKPGFLPKIVIMVDDRQKNLNDIEKVLKETEPDIQFHGFLYKGALDVPNKDISEAEFQKFWMNQAKKFK